MIKKHKVKIGFIAILIFIGSIIYGFTSDDVNIVNGMVSYYDLKDHTEINIFFEELESSMEELKDVKEEAEYYLEHKKFKDNEVLQHPSITFLKNHHNDIYECEYLDEDYRGDKDYIGTNFNIVMFDFAQTINDMKLNKEEIPKEDEKRTKWIVDKIIKKSESILKTYDEACEYYDLELKSAHNAKSILKRKGVSKFVYVYEQLNAKESNNDYIN